MKSICLTAAALLLSVSASAASDKIRWLNDWLPAGDNSAIYYGVASGIFEKAGIDVGIDNAKGSSDAITRLATGGADITSAGISALMQAKAEGDVPVTAVMSIFNTAPDVIATTESAGISSFADLKGKTTATAPFSSSNVIWPLVLGLNGLKVDDVKLQKADPTALGPLLASGQVDGVIVWAPTAVGLEEPVAQTGKKLKVLPWSDFGLDSYGASVLVADRLIKSDPDLVKRFVTAYKQAEEAALAHPKEAAEALKASVPEVEVDLAEKQLMAAMALTINAKSKAEGIGTFAPARLAATWKLVAEAQGLKSDAVDPEKVVDRSFIAGK